MSEQICPMCGDEIWIRHRRRAPLQRCDYCTQEIANFEMVIQINPEFADSLSHDEKIEEIGAEMARAFVHVGRVFGVNGK